MMWKFWVWSSLDFNHTVFPCVKVEQKRDAMFLDLLDGPASYGKKEEINYDWAQVMQVFVFLCVCVCVFVSWRLSEKCCC